MHLFPSAPSVRENEYFQQEKSILRLFRLWRPHTAVQSGVTMVTRLQAFDTIFTFPAAAPRHVSAAGEYTASQTGSQNSRPTSGCDPQICSTTKPEILTANTLKTGKLRFSCVSRLAVSLLNRCGCTKITEKWRSASETLPVGYEAESVPNLFVLSGYLSVHNGKKKSSAKYCYNCQQNNWHAAVFVWY